MIFLIIVLAGFVFMGFMMTQVVNIAYAILLVGIAILAIAAGVMILRRALSGLVIREKVGGLGEGFGGLFRR